MSNKTSFLASGDIFITRRIAQGGYEGYGDLVDLIKKHDVAFTNLEMTFHESQGYPAAESGGTWAMMEPGALDDIKAMGFNIFNTANNHSGDYGEGGILATIENLKKRDMVFSGTGENLAQASRPAYLETRNNRVALISVSSTFSEASRAGGQSQELKGRPGLNPLRFKTYYHVDKENFEKARELVELTYVNASLDFSIRNGYKKAFEAQELPLGESGIFILDEENWVETLPLEEDMKRIEEEIVEAKKQADIVIVSLHAHEFTGHDSIKPAMFLESFSRSCIDAGAQAVLGHGPHELRAIEIYRGCPIFYSLGNFLFQTETIALQPREAFINKGMDPDTKIGAFMEERSKKGTVGYGVQENIWRSVLASWVMEKGQIKEIVLTPIEMGLLARRSQKGLPRLSGDESTLEYLASLSEEYGTKIEIEDGLGYIRL